jgi:hypothetical protein
VKTSAAAFGKGKGKAKFKESEAGEEAVGLDDNKNDIDKHTVEICMYVNVKMAPPPALHVGGHITKAPAVKITPQGPFIFESNTSDIFDSSMQPLESRMDINRCYTMICTP